MPTITAPYSEGEVNIVAAAAYSLTYTTLATGDVLPATMYIYLDGSQVAAVDYLSKYTGSSFVFTLPNGTTNISGVFANGNVNLTTPTTTSGQTTTTSGPVSPAPNTAKNNGGTIKNGGNVGPKRKFIVSPKVYQNERQVVGSVVVDNNSANKAVSGGVFAHNTQSPIAKKVTVVLGGVSNTVLRSGAARPELVKSINSVQSVRTRKTSTAARAGKFNIYTGKFDTNYPAVTLDTFATDNAAAPTRDLPGQLVFKTGAKVPVTSNYKPKTN
ncbi:hypothetical protein EBZ38_11425 [bacterium]|nr:hypothetical protein [bacterium]NDC95092.1 hypothetical protein [bacterium]NDD84862.1 hypothetical protein [bacterium]